MKGREEVKSGREETKRDQGHKREKLKGEPGLNYLAPLQNRKLWLAVFVRTHTYAGGTHSLVKVGAKIATCFTPLIRTNWLCSISDKKKAGWGGACDGGFLFPRCCV